MSSALSTSKQQSTYPQSRLSIFSASVSEPGTVNRRSAMTSGKTTSSNNVSGLSVLNSANHNKPLRVERIDRATKSIKWASSVSDESETMKMCNNDHISKNIEEVSKLKEVGKNKGKTMSKNERRKNNQNNLEDKLLNLKLKDLDRQQSTLQAGIKREHYKLLDIYMNSKANNLNFLKAKADENPSNIDLTALNKGNNKKFHRLSNFNTTERETSRYGRETERDSQGSATFRSHSSFQTREMERYLEFINQPPPAQKPNIFSKIDERFIDQKIKYFPSYLRKAKGSVMSSDVDTALNRLKLLNSASNNFCSKHKKHRLAQMKAELYNNSKDMFGVAADEQNIDQQMADAEAAALAEMASAAAAKEEKEYEDHYSFGTFTPNSRMMFNDKTPLPTITPSMINEHETKFDFV